MESFTILEHGQEPGKPQRYARCLYGNPATDVTVIIDDQVLERLARLGVSDFPRIVRGALDAAQKVDGSPQQVAVLLDTPILDAMIARLVTERARSTNHMGTIW